MLEEVLKTINLNLERIANALEKANEPIVTPEIRNPINNIVMPTQTEPIQQQVIQNPVAQPVVTTTIPTTQVAESFTREQLATAMSKAVSAGKMNIIQGILQQFNVQALTEIAPSDYNKLATMLKEQGVEM